MNTQALMPVIFLGHGSPLSAFEENEFTNSWRDLGEKIQRPKGIIIFSAHWYTDELKVTSSTELETIYDFYGFPDYMYQYDYHGKSDESLVQKIAQLTGAKLDSKWGLDHGAWCLLKHMYPNSDIPVVQISIPKTMDITALKKIAKQLASLRKEGVLIIGSGNITHNLRMLDRSNSGIVYDWAIDYEKKLKNIFNKNDDNALIELINSEETKKAHSGVDHLLPAIICSYFVETNEQIDYFNEKIVYGSLSMTSFIIGGTKFF